MDFLSNDKRVVAEKLFANVATLIKDKFQEKQNFQEASYRYGRITQQPKQSVLDLAEEIRVTVNNMAPGSENNRELVRLNRI